MPWFCFTLIILVIELWLFPIWLFWKKLHIGKPMHKWHDATKPKDSSYFWFLSYILKKFNYRNYLSKNIFQHWKETKNCRFFSNFCCMIYLVIYIFFANAPGLDTWINLAWLWPYFRPELDGWDKIRTYHLSIVSLVCYPLSTIFVHFSALRQDGLFRKRIPLPLADVTSRTESSETFRMSILRQIVCPTKITS